jgi:hypothetical protein
MKWLLNINPSLHFIGNALKKKNRTSRNKRPFLFFYLSLFFSSLGSFIHIYFNTKWESIQFQFSFFLLVFSLKRTQTHTLKVLSSKTFFCCCEFPSIKKHTKMENRRKINTKKMKIFPSCCSSYFFLLVKESHGSENIWSLFALTNKVPFLNM